MWHQTEVTRQLDIRYPIIQAPMAGSTTPELVAAVSNQGGLGSIGAGYYTPEKLREDIRSTRALTDKPFAVNLFVPEYNEVTNTEIHRMKEVLAPYHENLGITQDEPELKHDDDFDHLVDVIAESGVKICSFTFGIPETSTIRKLKAAGVTLIGCATTVEEAVMNADECMDMVVMQGYEAGGHRGSFLNDALTSTVGTMALVPQAANAVDIPVIAAGGIMDGRGVYASLILGASAAQLGTAFLTTKESAAPRIHKDAILAGEESGTVLTRAFSGKYARGIRNDFMADMEAFQDEILPYPFQNQTTKKMRSEAAKAGRSDLLHLWSGQGLRLAREGEAAEIFREIVREVETIYGTGQ
ncbi:NAD(P)H-dependent flavin oxidoreductase [Lacicoccus alkaliphilus]|uniref:Probable nitronate monooxygenase n=1 Tax=Lacicoccus alkaliphilus DSM 16010 TaxID=1123231 RepID=A0A1M7ATD2_9BACL|nr:nitronate monooxygenase [Salinicoccus alkaliphilus]SHL45921.1 nitronate monooxygenase [Salinicoccus alkaliphilus DSM 16010]